LELRYLWDFYGRLSRRRQAGMAANPLTYCELEAFERKALVHFSAWEADLLMRVDDAVITVWAGQITKPKGREKTADGAIPVSNPTGLKALFRGLMGRKPKGG
jgi:hypothetical protein